MPSSFSRTFRSLRADRPTGAIGVLGVGVLLLGGWGAWMGLANVAVYEATATARLEVERASHPIQAPVAGRVVAVNLQLEQAVAVGDVLFELDSSAQRLELAQARARLTSIGPELAAAMKELDAHGQAVSDDAEGVSATVAEARAKLEEANVAEKHAVEQLTRAQRLRAEGLASDSELERIEADRDQKRAATDAARKAIGRIDASGRADLSDRRARREGLAREIAILEGEVKTTEALIARLQNEIALRTVRASVAGTIGEIAPVTVGAVVREGDAIGAIVPPGDLRIIAEYPSPRALGRIRVGQRARLRLDGFPWAQHGTVAARVARVAGEVREGRLRVELDVLPEHSATIALQHGLTGKLEVEVEHTTPLVLTVRAAGALLDGTEGTEGENRGVIPARSGP